MGGGKKGADQQQQAGESASKRAREAKATLAATLPQAKAPIPVTEAAASASTHGLDAGASTPAEPIVPTKPIVPTAEARDTDTLATMRGIIKYVKHGLRARLANHAQFVAEVALYKQAPLTIRASSADTSELISYKHEWSAESAAVSLQSTGRYEGGGNVLWLNPFTTSQETAQAAGPPPTWESVHQMADQFRVGQDPPGQTEKGRKLAKEKRLLFRTPLFVHASTLDALAKPSFPGTLELVSGHVALYGWYLAAYEALDAGGPAADEWVWALWQAGLTVSIHAQIVTSPSDLAAISLKASNEIFLWSKACGESFPTFAVKIALFCRDVMSQPVKDRVLFVKDVRYKGTAVVRNLLLGAFKYVEVIDDETHALFLAFERRFGKEVLTDKWNNMTRIIQICGKAADTASMWSDCTSTSALVALVPHVGTEARGGGPR